MADIDILRQLFLASGRGDYAGLVKAAELFIRDLIASNRHAEAKQLQQALSNTTAAKSASLEAFRSRSNERLIIFSDESVTTDRVMLTRESRSSVERLLLEHRQRTKLLSAGLTPMNKILFWGPPGCGKTMAARMLATELGLKFGVLRLSTTITSYVGETSANIQRVFDLAAETPMLLLLDEVDAIAKKRDDQNDVGELKRVVNSLLQNLDNFRSQQSIIVACSNHQYILDPAIWRRFDSVINFPLPGLQERRVASRENVTREH